MPAGWLGGPVTKGQGLGQRVVGQASCLSRRRQEADEQLQHPSFLRGTRGYDSRPVIRDRLEALSYWRARPWRPISTTSFLSFLRSEETESGRADPGW